VELLLRRPINSEEDIHFTLAASEAGLLFMDEVTLLHVGHSAAICMFDINCVVSSDGML
jgi:hypothetical protein